MFSLYSVLSVHCNCLSSSALHRPWNVSSLWITAFLPHGPTPFTASTGICLLDTHVYMIAISSWLRRTSCFSQWFCSRHFVCVRSAYRHQLHYFLLPCARASWFKWCCKTEHCFDRKLEHIQYSIQICRWLFSNMFIIYTVSIFL